MQAQIITTPLHLTIYGLGGIADNKGYAAKAFALSSTVWQLIKTHHIPNKGKNIWVYEKNQAVFAGVALEEGIATDILTQKTISLTKYAYYQHIGAYHLIQPTAAAIIQSLKAAGEQVLLPQMEIYGDWTNDETQLVTELFFALQ